MDLLPLDAHPVEAELYRPGEPGGELKSLSPLRIRVNNSHYDAPPPIQLIKLLEVQDLGVQQHPAPGEHTEVHGAGRRRQMPLIYLNVEPLADVNPHRQDLTTRQPQ